MATVSNFTRCESQCEVDGTALYYYLNFEIAAAIYCFSRLPAFITNYLPLGLKPIYLPASPTKKKKYRSKTHKELIRVIKSYLIFVNYIFVFCPHHILLIAIIRIYRIKFHPQIQHKINLIHLNINSMRSSFQCRK